MTEPSSVAAPASTAPAAPQKASFWEDLIDIFFSPAAVFRRNENKSVWPPLLFVSIAIGVIFFATFNQLEPIFDAEFTRGMTKAAAQNPQLNAETMAKMKSASEAVTRYGLTVIMFITILVVGAVSWLVGKLVGSAQTFHAALVVAAWSYMPRVIGSVLGGVQGLLMDPAKPHGPDGDLAQPRSLLRAGPTKSDHVPVHWSTGLDHDLGDGPAGGRAPRDRQSEQGPRDDLRRHHVAHRRSARVAPGLHVHVIASSGG